MINNKIRLIALYLPQFYPIKENDEVWGKGFTEWTNVAKGKPLFHGHYQPHIPADLGFYDLRLEQTRIAQAELANEYGIEGFCYWHYWFGNGDKILELPIENVLKSGKPDYPFCLAWANHSWTNATWTKINSNKKPIVIKEQKYLGKKDYELFFYDTLRFFQDKRYITVDGKPFFLIHDPTAIPDIEVFISCWQELAIKNGLKGIFFIGSSKGITYRDYRGRHNLPDANQTKILYDKLLKKGFDAINSSNFNRAVALIEGNINNFIRLYVNTRTSFRLLKTIRQERFNKYLLSELDANENVFPSVYSNWDRSPRVGKADIILTESSPEVFKNILEQAARTIENKKPEHKIILLRSWNEWGEGNHIEPDLRYGRGYLEAIKQVVKQNEK